MGDGFDRQEVRDKFEQGNSGKPGRQLGGGPGAGDMGAGAGSSGSGGYGMDQNAQNQQGQGERGTTPDPGQSRGERFDEIAGGGRGGDSVSFDRERDGVPGADEFGKDQRDHQDRGQSTAEEEEER